MDALGLAGKTVAVAGVATRRSVGWAIGKKLQQLGCEVVWIVHSEARREELREKLAPGEVHACDVQSDEEIDAMREAIARRHPRLDGFVHSIAFANYEAGFRPFHETSRADFLQAVDVSCYSFVRMAEAFRELFADDASAVTISISDTRMAAENYGYMAPAKAALDSAVTFLAKSFSRESGVRFNAVKAGLLKTSSSAGIPGYLESYLFAEQCTFRKRALETREVADVALFLLSPMSSGINGQGLVVDAGMGNNYFDRAAVDRAMRVDE